MTLNDKSFTPLYQQVLGDLKAGIMSGRYQPGDKLPSEAELSERYSVSRVTVRRALDELAGEGYLTSRQGKGTFVTQRKLTRKLRQSSNAKSFTDLCAEAGMTAGAHVLECQVVPVHSESRTLFGAECDKLVLVSRIRTADGIPIMEENNYFPLSRYAFLLDADLENVSIFSYIEKHCGLVPARYTSSTIEIALCEAERAERLGISAGDPLFFEHVFFLDQNDEPFCLSNKFLVGSRYLFEI